MESAFAGAVFPNANIERAVAKAVREMLRVARLLDERRMRASLAHLGNVTLSLVIPATEGRA